MLCNRMDYDTIASPYTLDYASFDSVSADDPPEKLPAEAQCLVDVLRSIATKKSRLSELVDEIGDIQKSIDVSFSEFEDAKARVDKLTTKYSVPKINFDALRDQIQEHTIAQRARLQELQPERDTLAADIGMIEKTMGSLVEKSSSCSVCYERQANVALKPCGHVYCETCVSRIDTRRCPKCRDLINGQIKLYF